MSNEETPVSGNFQEIFTDVRAAADFSAKISGAVSSVDNSISSIAVTADDLQTNAAVINNAADDLKQTSSTLK